MVEDLRRLPSAPAPKELKSNVDDGKRQGRSRIRRHRHRKSRSEYHLALLANIVQESECGIDMHEEEIIALDDPNEFPALSVEQSLPSQKPIEILHEESIVIPENANEDIGTKVAQVLDYPAFNHLPVAMKERELDQQTHLKQAPMTKKTKKGSTRKVASSRPSKVDAIKRRTQKDPTPTILDSVDSIKDHDTKDISLKCAKFLRNVQVKCNITILKPIWRCVDMPWGKDRPEISLSKLKKTMLKSLRVSAVKPLFSNTSAAGQIIA